MTRITETRAIAKTNLFLRIVGRAASGFHEIETLFAPVQNPSDVIRVEEKDGPGLEMTARGFGIPVDKNNLCWKAAEAYAAKTGLAPSWRIDIEKNIPVAAGLGGGSSDCAAVLRALNDRHGLLDETGLSETALSLGSDVPFFLAPTPSVGRGRGEKLTPLDVPSSEMPLLLAAPLFPVSAGWAYKNRMRDEAAENRDLDSLTAALREKDWEKCGALLRNDLSRAVFEKFPVLGLLRDEIKKRGATGVEVSGSGPTLLAVFKSHADLSKSVESLEESPAHFPVRYYAANKVT